MMRSAVGAFVAETVGAGIEANSAHPDRENAEQIDATWLDAYAILDAEGRTDGRGLIANMVEAERVDGEAFALMEDRGGRVVVRQIPAEWVDESHTTELGDGGYVVSGIEHSALGERVAYNIRPTRPTDLFPTAAERIRVPAEDVLHLAHGLAPGQVRGVSALAPILLKLSEYDQATDALLMKLKVSAMHVAFITDVNGTAGSAYGAAGIGEEGLEPGAMYRLGMGEDVKTAFPEYPSCARGFVDPHAVGLDQRISGFDQLAHEGYQSDFRWFSGLP
jgi:capsid protein